eukprot:TRINITY_DN2963_c0_g1_i1.p1 TRINITY_DN2963_c0_g1~~TRINITY_DN2963_c0_g1_i1.p1  ORF type:complete len:279 (+),score=59.95 TRINITY_DN2963_c0_g1_i1:222-1058(+)
MSRIAPSLVLLLLAISYGCVEATDYLGTYSAGLTIPAGDHRITGNIFMTSKLVVQPGARVWVQDRTSILIQSGGSVEVDGAEFYTDSNRRWGQFFFSSTAATNKYDKNTGELTSGSFFRNTRFFRGGNYHANDGILDSESSGNPKFVVENCHFENANNKAFIRTRGQTYIRNSTFIQTTSYAVVHYYGTFELSDCRFENTGYVLYHRQTGTNPSVIKDLTAKTSNNRGLYVRDARDPQISNLHFENVKGWQIEYYNSICREPTDSTYIQAPNKGSSCK